MAESDEKKELLPCPFCGSDAIVYDDGEDWIASCNGDDCSHMPCCVGNNNRAEATASWNRRSPPQSRGGADAVTVPRDLLNRARDYVVMHIKNDPSCSCNARGLIGQLDAALTGAKDKP